MIYNAVEVVKLATNKITAPGPAKIHRIRRLQPATDFHHGAVARSGYHNQCLKTAFERHKSAIEGHDYQLAVDYWLAEFPQMADKTRSSILAGVMGVLHVFNTGIVRELVSTTTNVTPADMFEGKVDSAVNFACRRHGVTSENSSTPAGST